MIDISEPTTEPAEIQQMDRDRVAGWGRFTHFLLINVVAAAVSLLLIAAFTVWS